MEKIQKSNRLTNLESWAKVVSLVAIPIILAVGGWLLQSSLKRGDIKHEYVKLSISILKARPTDTNRPLRQWAVKLFNEYSLVKLDDKTSDLLVSGKLRFPDTASFAAIYKPHAYGMLYEEGALPGS